MMDGADDENDVKNKNKSMFGDVRIYVKVLDRT